ncbi:MAG: division/cell wall cluster transcriptional repressor MraZ [Eubacterium sp.]|nr:division/cell wall cluster transcriptional repressor MraZ [Eubacterium sp.]
MVYSMTGEFRHNIDSKGRLIVPSKLRDALGSKIYVTISVDKCLNIYSTEEFEKFTEKLEQIDTSTERGRMIKRYFLANATDCELDAQGRIIIPNNLKEYAGLSKEVVIVGSKEKAEIWDSAVYDSMYVENGLTQEDINKEIEQLGLQLF